MVDLAPDVGVIDVASQCKALILGLLKESRQGQVSCLPWGKCFGREVSNGEFASGCNV